MHFNSILTGSTVEVASSASLTVFQNMHDFWFNTCFAFLVTHELDAVRHHEWRILPLFNLIKSDELGFQAFTVAHVPLQMLLFHQCYTNSDTQLQWRTGLCIFSIIHLSLHWFYRKHPLYTFHNWLSWSLIAGCAFSGAMYLLQ